MKKGAGAEYGRVLIVFSRRRPEALNPADEEFGEDRLKEVLRAVRELPVEEMASRIADEMKNWIQDAAQYDDLTFLLLSNSSWGGQSWPQPPFRRLKLDVSAVPSWQRDASFGLAVLAAERRLQPGLAAPPA